VCSCGRRGKLDALQSLHCDSGVEEVTAHLLLVVQALKVVLEVIPTGLVIAFSGMKALQQHNYNQCIDVPILVSECDG
jgi:hypothetical protein